MDKICKLSEDYDLRTLEDSAQVHGTFMKEGRQAIWEMPLYSIFSKTFIDRGVVTTDDYELARLLRNFGSSKKYVNGLVGYNSRFDELEKDFQFPIKLSRPM
jgi:dTDP-4-amino-4,6-dideoxygalactose transaminase